MQNQFEKLLWHAFKFTAEGEASRFNQNSHVAHVLLSELRPVLKIEGMHSLHWFHPSTLRTPLQPQPANQRNQGAIHKAGCYAVVSHSSPPTQPHYHPNQ